MTKITQDFAFTDRALTAMRAAGAKSVSFPSSAAAPQPAVGDLFSHYQFGSIVFRVIQRELHWQGNDHMNVRILLDDPGEFTPWPLARPPA